MPKKKEMTDFEHQCLVALVAEYGAPTITDCVASIAAQAEQDEERSELQYYAAARDDGWSFGDEDSPHDYCDTHLSDEDVDNADVEAYREEFTWWKAKP